MKPIISRLPVLTRYIPTNCNRNLSSENREAFVLNLWRYTDAWLTSSTVNTMNHNKQIKYVADVGTDKWCRRTNGVGGRTTWRKPIDTVFGLCILSTFYCVFWSLVSNGHWNTTWQASSWKLRTWKQPTEQSCWCILNRKQIKKDN